MVIIDDGLCCSGAMKGRVCRLTGSLSQWMDIGHRGQSGAIVHAPAAAASKQLHVDVTVQGTINKLRLDRSVFRPFRYSCAS